MFSTHSLTPLVRESREHLSPVAQRVLRFIRDYFNTTSSTPTVREIMRYLGFRSTNSVYKQLKKLEEAGAIEKTSSGRLVLPHPTSLRFAGTVHAGFATPVEDSRLDVRSLDSYLVRNPERTFLLRVVGDSMVNAGIIEGDLVLVERGQTYVDGDIVVVHTPDGYIVKHIHTTGKTPILRSANERFEDIEMGAGDVVFGVVTSVVRQVKQ